MTIVADSQGGYKALHLHFYTNVIFCIYQAAEMMRGGSVAGSSVTCYAIIGA